MLEKNELLDLRNELKNKSVEFVIGFLIGQYWESDERGGSMAQNAYFYLLGCADMLYWSKSITQEQYTELYKIANKE